MRVTTKISWDLDTREVLLHEWYDYPDDAPIDKACGPSEQQKDLALKQADFANLMQSNFSERFAGQDAILSKLNVALTPVVAAGPNQQGFNAAELGDLNARALNTTAANYGNAARAVNGELAGRGGDSGLQSGVDSQIKASFASEAAKQLSGEQSDINLVNYQTGRQNYNTALSGMHALSGQYDPTQYGNLAGNGFQNAFSSQHSIDQQKGAFWKTLGGVVTAGVGMLPGIGTGIGAIKSGIGALSGGGHGDWT